MIKISYIAWVMFLGKLLRYLRCSALLCMGLLGRPLHGYDVLDGFKVYLDFALGRRLDYYNVVTHGYAPITKVLGTASCFYDEFNIDGVNPSGQNNSSAKRIEPPVFVPNFFFGPNFIYRTSTQKRDKGFPQVPSEYLSFVGRHGSFSTKFAVMFDWMRCRLGLGSHFSIAYLKTLSGRLANGEEVCVQNRYNYTSILGTFVLVGVKIYRNLIHALLVDISYMPEWYFQYPFTQLGSKLQCVPYLNTFDVGLRYEYRLNRFMNGCIRLALERSWKEQAQGYIGGSGGIDHEVCQQRFSVVLQVGCSFLLLRRLQCPVYGCRADCDHNHHRRVYRGYSWTR